MTHYTSTWRAYKFFLSAFTLFERSPDQTNSCSHLYLLDALHLIAQDERLVEEIAHWPSLNALLTMTTSGEAPAKETESWTLPESWPQPLQACFFDMSLMTGFGNPDHVLTELETWLTNLKNPPTSISPAFSEAVALASLVGRLHPSAWNLVGRVLDRLNALRRSFPEKSELAAQYGIGLLNVLVSCYYTDETGKVEQLLGEIGDAYRSFPNSSLLGELRASALATSVSFYIPNGDMKRVDGLISELEYLHGIFSANAYIRESLIKGLGNAIGALAMQKRMGRVKHLLRQVRRLEASSGGSERVAEQVVTATSNAIRGYCDNKEMDEAEILLRELQRYQQLFPQNTRIKEIRAMDLAIALPEFGNSGQMDGVERMLSELKILDASRPDEAGIARWLAEGLVGCRKVTITSCYASKLV